MSMPIQYNLPQSTSDMESSQNRSSQQPSQNLSCETLASIPTRHGPRPRSNQLGPDLTVLEHRVTLLQTALNCPMTDISKLLKIDQEFVNQTHIQKPFHPGWNACSYNSFILEHLDRERRASILFRNSCLQVSPSTDDVFKELARSVGEDYLEMALHVDNKTMTKAELEAASMEYCRKLLSPINGKWDLQCE